MVIPAGTHHLGPENGTLSLRTGRTGAAAKAGHDLLIEVTSWSATVTAGDDPADTVIALDADGGSLRVVEGTGGMKSLSEDDKADIVTVIADEILKHKDITLRSTAVTPDGDGLRVEADLTLHGAPRPVVVALTPADGGLRGVAVITQSDWGVKPYSTLFGALKVSDQVTVELDARLPAG